MAKIGYARVSSKEQHLDRQLAALKDVDKLFTDKLSGANTNRPELQKMLAYIREGDIVMVTELDRLGRNNQDLTKIMNSIQNKGATLDVLNLPSMTGIADPNLRQLMTNLIIELYKYQDESERIDLFSSRCIFTMLALKSSCYRFIGMLLSCFINYGTTVQKFMYQVLG